MIQGNFLFPKPAATSSRGNYYMQLKIYNNTTLGDTVTLSISEEAMTDIGIEQGSRLNIGFDDRGWMAIKIVDAGGFKVTGAKIKQIKALAKNFPNLPKHMDTEYTKTIDSFDVAIFPHDNMLTFNTAIKGE